MKTLYIFFVIFILFFDVGLTQQERDTFPRNGWDLLVSWGVIDTINTFTYFKSDSGQIFKHKGIPKLIEPKSPEVLCVNWKKIFLSQKLEKKISGEFNLSDINNIDSLEVYIMIVDSTGNWSLLGKKFILKQGWQTLIWDMSEVSAINTFNEILFVFQFWTKNTLSISGTITLRNLNSIDSNNVYKPIDLTIITGISDPKQIQIPKEFELSQNYPNPFNPSTKIKFTVPTSSYVSLTIFNSLGQKVRTLIQEEKSEGVYEVSFDASNLPSGTYFYKLQAGSFVETKKMLLLK